MSIKKEIVQQVRTTTPEIVAESLGITVAEAKHKMRSMTFRDYLSLTEANTDNNPWLTSGTTSSASTSSSNFDNNNNQPDIDVENMSDEDVDNLLQAMDVWDTENSSPANKRQEIEQKLRDPKIQDKMKNHMSDFKSGFSESSIARLKELAGITETATVGSTSAGNISGMPSIVGDTSDSHKPTNKLITRMKQKREDRKREQEKEAKKRKREDGI